MVMSAHPRALVTGGRALWEQIAAVKIKQLIIVLLIYFLGVVTVVGGLKQR